MSLNSVDVIVTNQEIGSKYKEKGSFSTEGSAGVDLYAAIEHSITLKSGECILVDTGIKINIKDPKYAAMILPRSGKGAKEGIVIGNLVGLIDSDYQGPLKMAIWNRNKEIDVEICPLEKLCQLIFVPIERPSFNYVESFEMPSSRGEGGFGHTGN